MGTFWTWMILIAVWWVLLTATTTNFVSNLPDWVVAAFMVVLALWIIVVLAFGSMEFLRYNQAWPFVPQ